MITCVWKNNMRFITVPILQLYLLCLQSSDAIRRHFSRTDRKVPPSSISSSTMLVRVVGDRNIYVGNGAQNIAFLM